MAYEPLHHKYRPQTFADLVGQEAIAATLSNAILSERIAPAYLFTGPRGTGKTSSARILAKSLNCVSGAKPTPSPCGQCETCRAIILGSALDVIEIDAASNTGVDNIREIIERAQFAPVQCRYKVYVIDECHMLSAAAFNALLKTLEEPPERVIFVLATTDPQRVLPTIISRCQRFDYRRIPLTAMVNHLQTIADKENINIDPTALNLVGQMANGGLRDAESLLDQLSLIAGVITPEKVWDLVGAVPERDLLALLEALAQDEAEAVLRQCRQILNRGREPLTVLQNLAGFYLNLLIAKTAPKSADLVTVTQETWRSLVQLAQQWEIGAILQGQQRLKESEVQLRNTTQPRLWLEVTLLNLLPSACVSAAVKASPGQPTTPRVTAQPITTPVKTTLQEETVTPPLETASETVDLDSLWAQVLNQLPNFSQGLFRANSQLTALDDYSAQICVKSAFLLIKNKVQELESAFANVLGRSLRVQLHNPGAGELEKSAPVETAPPRPAPERPAPVNPPPAATSSPAPQSVSQPVLDRKPIVEEQPRPPAPLEDGQKVSVQKAVEQLAKSFDGAIIPPDPQETPALEPPKPKVKGRPPVVIPEGEDEDIPF
ncbi:MAG: DNA polymerase III subunit gamma/tau [Cyanobacteriota bacterium]|nr:DNA polymerase III subunit gamma/tau [Cyanobacteriota bacterium]